MNFYTFTYFIKEALKSLKRNFMMSLGAIIIITSNLFFLGVFAISFIILANSIGDFGDKLKINVYLQKDLSKDVINEIYYSIFYWPQIENIKYISKDQAKEELKKILGDTGDIILPLIKKNPLPDSFEIKVKDIHFIKSVVQKLKAIKGVEDVEYGGEIVEKVEKLDYLLKRWGVIVFLILIFSSIMVISSTTQLTVYARRDEIEIMKLVGATNWFIRWPIMFEGIIEGFIAALISVFMTYKIYTTIIVKIQELLPFLSFTGNIQELISVFVLLLGVGIVIGAFGSLFSTMRFLEVQDL